MLNLRYVFEEIRRRNCAHKEEHLALPTMTNVFVPQEVFLWEKSDPLVYF